VRTERRIERGPVARRALGVALLALALLLAIATVARAQTFTVTNLSDSGVTGDGSLRGEVRAANANPGADTIAFASGLSGQITLSGNGLQIEDPVDIEGPGPGQLVVAQSSAQRVIHVHLGAPGAVTIAGLHIADGTAPDSGSAADHGGDILNEDADLTVSDAVISGGTASLFSGGFYHGYGGGISSDGAPLTLLSTIVSGNRADYGGGAEVGSGAEFHIEGSTILGNSVDAYAGGIEAHGGTGTIDGSTISGNTAVGQGAGGSLWATGSSAITVRNSTVSGNTSSSGVGGGLDLQTYQTASLTIVASTVAANQALAAGGMAVARVSGALPAQLEDTIVATNSASIEAADVRGPVTTAFSLIGDPAGATIAEAVPGSDLLGVDPQLGPLQDNGGPTQTMALSPSSPAVNTGSAYGLGNDERSDPRPVLYPGVPLSTAPGADGADIGAFELQAPPPVAPSPATAPPAAPAATKGAPRVRVNCPKSAKPGGCRFALQVLSARPHKPKRNGKRSPAPKPVAESAVARVKLGPGKSALVTLIPKPQFAAKLAAAAKLLVRETATVAGKSDTVYRRLKVAG
jgi:hypothetical protein